MMEKTTPLKHQNRQNDYESLEKHILSVFHSGVYVSSHDLVQIGNAMGNEYPYKERDILLKKMLGDARENGNFNELLAKLTALLKHRAAIYTELGNTHMAARDVISRWLQKAKTTDRLIKSEISKAHYEQI